MGKSKFNPVYEFDSKLMTQTFRVRVTSVLGNLTEVDFPDSCKNWTATNIESLFKIPLVKKALDSSVFVV